MLPMFESQERKRNDMMELSRLKNRFGDDMVNILAKRANDVGLGSRDRKHWQRLYRKAKSAL